jgi:hypothetical protein
MLTSGKYLAIWHVKDPWGSGGLNDSLSAPRLQLTPIEARDIQAEDYYSDCKEVRSSLSKASS